MDMEQDGNKVESRVTKSNVIRLVKNPKFDKFHQIFVKSAALETLKSDNTAMAKWSADNLKTQALTFLFDSTNTTKLRV